VPSAQPPAGQDFYRRFGDANPDPYAVYGYEAMRLILDAVSVAGHRRRRIIRTLHRMPNRAGTIGTYRFDRFGDTTLRRYAVYRVEDELLEFAGVVRAR
jgi:branched-chain amino acid transport system substrate-binding protein